MTAARPRRVVVSWSGGKDAAWALHTLRQTGDYTVVGLLTSVNGAAGRVAMHDIRQELVAAQAAVLGLPLLTVALPWPCPNAEYESAMSAACARMQTELGATHIAFGDLFLEDIRRYREDRLRGTGLSPLFPLWGEPTAALARRMVREGLRATLACVDPRRLPSVFAGRVFDEPLLSALPPDVDPCGERGEFHTFVWEGPMFPAPLAIRPGDVLERDGFVFADLCSAPEDSGP